jgi:hypothetical protein
MNKRKTEIKTEYEKAVEKVTGKSISIPDYRLPDGETQTSPEDGLLQKPIWKYFDEVGGLSAPVTSKQVAESRSVLSYTYTSRIRIFGESHSCYYVSENGEPSPKKTSALRIWCVAAKNKCNC